MYNKITIITVVGFIVVFASSLFIVNAQQMTPSQAQNHPGTSAIEGTIALLSSAMAIFLFALSANAYRKGKRKRFLFVSAAFLLFTVKELYLPQVKCFCPLNRNSLRWFQF